MTTLIKELLALNEAKGQTYQVKHGNYKWDDVTLDIRDLDTLVKEITMNPSGKEAADHKWKDLGELHAYILEYHGVSDDEAINKNRGVFDAIDEDYEVESYKDDVLKIKYRFTIRYTNENKDHRQVEDTITLMPGN